MLKLRLQCVESRAAEDWSKFDAITDFETDIFGTYTDSPDFPSLRPKDLLSVSLLLIPPFPANIRFHGGF